MIFITFFCLLYCLNIVNAASPTYQSLYSKCQAKQAGCVVLSFIKGFNRATQAGVVAGDQLQCANDGSANQVCTYKLGGSAEIFCTGSDAIEVTNNGNVMTATFYGNSKENFGSSGDGTSIFEATCETQG